MPGGRIAQEGARIILLAPAGSDPLYYELGVAGEPVQREIESACTRCGVGLESFVFSYESGYLNLYRPGSTRAEKLPDDHLVLGYIVIAVIPDFLPEDLIVRLADTRTPSAIIDIAGIPRIPLGMTANQYIQFFTMSAGSTPGVHVARFLKNLGHKRIAWISPYHKSEWSRQRLKGLQSLYPGSERSPGVYCLSIEKILPSYYAATSIPPHHTQKLDNFFRSWARDIADIPRAYFDEQKSEFARNALDYTEMLAALVPLFERLLKQRTITAWVAANDYVADMAYRFLRYKKIAIPARISLAGFDDTDLSLRRGITSYNFNAAALANAAASFCLDFSAKGKSARGVVEIEGRMTVRATTGRPSAQS